MDEGSSAWSFCFTASSSIASAWILELSQHHARVPLQPREPRALHGRLPKRGTELRLLHREEILREGRRILVRDKFTRLESGLLQLPRELDIERTAGLNDPAPIP